MALKVISEHLNGIKLLENQIFSDERGEFMEIWKESNARSIGLPTNFKQDNYSLSRKKVLRGLHYQHNPPQGKLIRVCSGSAFFC